MQSIFTKLQKKITRRAFLQHSAALLAAMSAALTTQKKRLTAKPRLSAMADPAQRPKQGVYFAIIGDYGKEDTDVARIASMVRSWEPDFITTVGDNIYGYESFKTVDACIGQYFTRFVSPYKGQYGPDSGTNRFYPILGNHDWETIEVDENDNISGPYFDFFPEREAYYTFQQGPVRFFMLDSYDDEPAGNTPLSKQAMWLRDQLAQSDATWNLVYLHHSPYSSGIKHGSHQHLQWPFAEWGAHAVLSGHNHTFERIERDGIVYFVNGLGGTSQHGLSKPPLAGSQAGYTNTFGAQLVGATDEAITFEFINRDVSLLDSYTLYAKNNDLEPSTDPDPNHAETRHTIRQRLSNRAQNGVEQLSDGALIAATHLLDFNDAADQYMTGLRFSDILIPRNATIINAQIEFTASARNGDPASIQIHAEKDCYAANYKSGNQPISQRPKTASVVDWSNVEAWSKVGASYWTPSLTEIVREVVEQASWSQGNAIAFIFSGQGKRPSAAHDLQPLAAPQLHIEYSVPIESESLNASTNSAPEVDQYSGGQRIYLPSIVANQCEVPEE